MLRLRFLGAFRVEWAGQPVPGLSRLQGAGGLFAYLALHPYQPIPRERLVQALWPEMDPARGRAALSAAFYRLRRQLEAALGPRSLFQADATALAFHPQVPWGSDLHAFQRDLERAAAAPSLRARWLLERAIARYHGDPLEPWEAPWIEDMRQDVRARYIEALERLWRLCDQLQDEEAAVRWAERLVTCRPDHEGAIAFLIRRALERHDPTRATRWWKVYRTACGAMGRPPSEAVRRLMAQGLSPSIGTSLGRWIGALRALEALPGAPPATPLWEGLARWLTEGIEGALRAGDYYRAAGWAASIWGVLAASTSLPPELEWRLRASLDAVADFWRDRRRQRENLSALARLARRMEDPDRRAEAAARQAWALMQEGRWDGAERLLRGAEDALTRASPLWRARLRRLRGLIALRRGWILRSRDLLESAGRQTPEEARVDRAALHNALGVAYWRLGDYRQALAHLETGQAILGSEGPPMLCFLLRGNRAVLEGLIHGLTSARLEELAALCQEAQAYPDAELELWMLYEIGRLALRWGNLPLLRSVGARLADSWRRSPLGYEASRVALLLALTHAMQRRPAMAQRWAERAWEGARRWKRDDVGMMARALQAHLDRDPEALGEALTLAGRVGWAVWETFLRETAPVGWDLPARIPENHPAPASPPTG